MASVSASVSAADMASGDTEVASAPVDVRIVAPRFYPMLVGPGVRFRRYAPKLRERGIDLGVVTVRYPGLEEHEVIDGIEVRRVPRIGGASPEQELGVSSWRDRAFVYNTFGPLLEGDRPDVVQLFAGSHWTAPYSLAVRALGVPTLLVFTMMGDRDGSWLKNRIRDLHRRAMIDPFTHIVTSSTVMARELRGVGVSGRKIDVIPNGVDLERFRPPVSEEERHGLRTRLGLDPTGEIVLFVGHIAPRKGVAELLGAWSEVAGEHPEARLVLVGPVEENREKYPEYHRRLGELVKRSPDPERIVFAGAATNVEEYYRAADVLVFPSAREGMPNVPPEAMATGLPCVITPFQGLPEEFGEPGREYLLADRTPAAIGEALSGLLGDPSARRRLGRRAREWVEENLDVEHSLDRFADVYRALATG